MRWATTSASLRLTGGPQVADLLVAEVVDGHAAVLLCATQLLAAVLLHTSRIAKGAKRRISVSNSSCLIARPFRTSDVRFGEVL